MARRAQSAAGGGLFWALVLAIFLAYALRLYRIDYQSLWGDELLAVFRAASDLIELARNTKTVGNQVPLYYYILHFWQQLFGITEFALRYLSLVFGVLTIPLLYRLGERTLGRRSGLFAAVIGAFSPFLVYYSQETRMYAQATFFSALSIYFFIEILLADPKQLRLALWSGYILGSAAAIYSHYFSAFVILAQALYFLCSIKRHRRIFWPWVASQVAILGLLVPWVVYAWRSLILTGESVERGSIGLGTIVQNTFTALSLGNTVDSKQKLLAIGFGLLFLLGLLTLRREKAFFWVFLLLIPVLAAYVVSFVPHEGWARYLSALGPAVYVTMGHGVDFISRKAPALVGFVLLFVLVADGISLNNYYHDPRYARNDFRSQVRLLEEKSLPSAAVVVNGPRRFPNFYYYFKNTILQEAIPRQGVSTHEEIETELRKLATSHSGLWLVKYNPPDYDTGNFIEEWLARNGFKTEITWVENVTFSFYSMPQGTEETGSTPSHPLPTIFENQIALVGYDKRVIEEKKGKVIQLSLYCKALQKVKDDLTVFAHVLDSQGKRIGQRDSQPIDGFQPTSSWKVGEIIRDRTGLFVPEELWSDDYHIELGLYRLTDGSRLNTMDPQGKAISNHIVIASKD